MSAKKKLPTSILSSSQKGEKEKKNLEDVPFELLFQRMVPFDGIIMCNQDIKTHSLAVGSRVIVSVGSSFIICTIGASKVGLQSGVVIVGKTLQPNFDISNGTSSSSALKVKISTDFRRYSYIDL